MTNFSANQLLLLTNQICQSFAVIVFKFKDHRLLHKSHKVQTLAFSRKNFSSTETERRGHSFDYSWRSQEFVGEKTFHDGSFNLIRDPRPLSMLTMISSKLNKFTPSCTSTVVFVLTIFRTNNTPSPKTSKLLLFSFYLKTEYIYSKAFQVQNLLFSNHYAKMEKKWKLSFQAMNDSLCGIKWNR